MRPLRGGKKLVLAAFIPSLLIALIWAFTIPRYAGDEEIPHSLHAASVVNKGLFSSDEPSKLYFKTKPEPVRGVAPSKTWDVIVPAGLANLDSQRCFLESPTTTPDCARDLPFKGGMIEETTEVGGYPPFFAFISGLPGLIFSPVSSLYLSRIIHAVIVAGLLSLAARSLWRMYGVRMLAPFIVLVTPNVFILGSGVNPVGIMIASCIALWATASSYAQYGWHLEGRLLIFLSFIASLTTPFAPWMVFTIIAVSLIHAIGPGQWARRIRIYDYVMPFVWSFMAVGVGIIWNLSAHSYTIAFPEKGLGQDVSWKTMLRESFMMIPTRLQQLVETLQNQSVEVPLWITTLWIVAAVTLFVLGFWYATDKEQNLLILLLIGTFITPVVIDMATGRETGFAWPGVYMAPLFFAAAMLCIDIYSRQKLGKSKWLWTAVWLVPIVPIQLGTWLFAMSRFAHGAGASVWLWNTEQQWFGPVSSVMMLYMLAAALGLLVTAASLDCWPESVVKWSRRPLPEATKSRAN